MDEQLIREIVANILAKEKNTSHGESLAPNYIPVEVSARHVHLSSEDVECLFGSGYELKPLKPLSQPGQFLCEERVKLVGGKSEIADVAILGPIRGKTQVEVSMTDAYTLGIEPPLRLSGCLDGARDVIIMAGSRFVDARQSVIVAQSHIHMTPTEAQYYGLQDGQCVKVALRGIRPITFDRVVIRVSGESALRMHIDFDEANAALIAGSMQGEIISTGCATEQIVTKIPDEPQKAIHQGYDCTEKVITESIAENLCKNAKKRYIFPKGTIITPLAKDIFRNAKAEWKLEACSEADT